MQIDQFPAGWTTASIGDLCDLNPRHDRKLKGTLKVSFVPMASVSDELGEIVTADERLLSEVRNGYTHFEDGDVLWAKITPCMQNGKSAVARQLLNGRGCGTTEFYVLRSKGAVLAAYLHQFMRQPSYLREAERSMSGAVGQARVPKEFVADTRIPLPPPSEQRRIVDRLSEIEGRRRAAKEKLDRLPELLNQYCQSILAAAFRGALTADWRDQHPDAEPAGDAIKAEYCRRWVEHTASVATDRAETAALRKGMRWAPTEREQRMRLEVKKAEKLYTSPPSPDTSDLPDIPEGWSWMQLSELIPPDRPLCYGVVQPGKAPSEGVPLIRVQDLTGGRVATDELRLIASDIDEQYERSRVEPGDVLVSLVGTIGRVAVVDDQVGYANIARAVGRVAVLSDLGEWVAICLQSPQIQDWLVRESREVARKTLNLGTLAGAFIPVPPLAEAAEAVSRINEHLRRCEAIRAAGQKARERAEALRQATLARAFRGELVPTEAELARREGRGYETAEALLNRSSRGSYQTTQQ